MVDIKVGMAAPNKAATVSREAMEVKADMGSTKVVTVSSNKAAVTGANKGVMADNKVGMEPSKAGTEDPNKENRNSRDKEVPLLPLVVLLQLLEPTSLPLLRWRPAYPRSGSRTTHRPTDRNSALTTLSAVSD